MCESAELFFKGKLFVKHDGTVLVGEFGLAALCYTFAAFVPSISFTGLSRWLSPESLDAMDETEEQTLASDVWALGCMLFEVRAFGLRMSGEKKAGFPRPQAGI
jgi:serine/threonine protein kinase